MSPTERFTFPLYLYLLRRTLLTFSRTNFFPTLPLFSLSNSPSPRAQEPITAAHPAVSNVCACSPRPFHTILVGFRGDVIRSLCDWPEGERRRANDQTQR